MDKTREMTCIICPNGCNLKVKYEESEVFSDTAPGELEAGNNLKKNSQSVSEEACHFHVQGALCNRGIEYAASEITNPTRNLTTTIKVLNGVLPLVSVRSTKPVPKEKIREAVTLLREQAAEAPVDFHQVVFKNILGTGADIIATREVKRA